MSSTRPRLPSEDEVRECFKGTLVYQMWGFRIAVFGLLTKGDQRLEEMRREVWLEEQVRITMREFGRASGSEVNR